MKLRRLWGVVALCLLGSCEYEVKIAKLEDKLEAQHKAREAEQAQINDLRSEQEKIWVALRCKNPKVMGFIESCKSFLGGGDTAQCSSLNVEEAMKFMRDEPHILVRLWPSDSQLKRVTKHRSSQLDWTFKSDPIRSITRVLVVTQPQSEKPEHTNEAAQLGRRMKSFLIERYALPAANVLGPVSITCRGKTQFLDMYSRSPLDQVDPDEPQARDAKVLVWVFRLDCGS